MAGTATRNDYSTEAETILYLALELGDAHWKLGFTTGFGQKPRLRTIGAGDIDSRGSKSRQLAELHGGRLTVDSTVAKGGPRVSARRVGSRSGEPRRSRGSPGHFAFSHAADFLHRLLA